MRSTSCAVLADFLTMAVAGVCPPGRETGEVQFPKAPACQSYLRLQGTRPVTRQSSSREIDLDLAVAAWIISSLPSREWREKQRRLSQEVTLAAPWSCPVDLSRCAWPPAGTPHTIFHRLTATFTIG